MAKAQKHILAALFDVRPVTPSGDLDVEKIEQVEAVLNLREAKTGQETQERAKAIKVKRETPRWEELPVEELPTKEEILTDLEKVDTLNDFLETSQGQSLLVHSFPKEALKETPPEALEEFYFPEVASYESSSQEEESVIPPKKARLKSPIFSWGLKNKPLAGFLIAGLLISLIIPIAAWLGHGFKVKEEVLNNSLSAYQNLLAAQGSLKQANWQAAEQNFSLAHLDFYQAHQEIKKLGQLTLGILERLPGTSLVSSGSHLVKVGENLAQAGQNLTSAINLFPLDDLFSLISLPGLTNSSQVLAAREENNSLTDLIALAQSNLSQALKGINLAKQELNQVEIEALPEEIQSGLISLKEKLPLVEEMAAQASIYSEYFLNILGHNNPRQYLLIFQNNSEIRATGGFIGTYGLLTLDKGEIKKLFIDGVFNADGQLREKVVPPRPIQKISTAWSMHDANWFADFPTSAKKITWFYEKTGGPTVDGVISFTPTVIERLMNLTGPILMPEYEITLTADNFVELIQYKVEVDYDKELNRPKKILADFTPKFMAALNQLPSDKRKEALEIIFDCLSQKHILIYFDEPALEELATNEGWAGQLLSTDKDYLSVVSSNINGYKTDRVTEESIIHQAEIQKDGSIIDTLVITRSHQGGGTDYEWWNRVNANYLRVYLPKGTQLISAEGQSLEIYQPPIDYQEAGFKIDPLVSSIENKMVIDKKTSTRIFQESNKTVFANWVYVSPGETINLIYKYKLPFKVDLTKPTDSYSLLAQKQAGSLGSQFSHQLKFPTSWQISWHYPEGMSYKVGTIDYQSDLKIDRFLGVTFGF